MRTNILISSDWHVPPEGLKPEHQKLLAIMEERLEDGWAVVFAGDIWCAKELGWRVYKDTPFIHQLHLWQRLYPNKLIIIEGNHDRRNPYLKTCRSWATNGVYASHWDEFDKIWSWLQITRFPVPRFIRRLHRSPGTCREEARFADWHISSAFCEFRATNRGARNRYKAVIGGHTHSPVVIKREGITIANAGDMVSSFTYLQLVGGEPKILEIA